MHRQAPKFAGGRGRREDGPADLRSHLNEVRELLQETLRKSGDVASTESRSLRSARRWTGPAGPRSVSPRSLVSLTRGVSVPRRRSARTAGGVRPRQGRRCD